MRRWIPVGLILATLLAYHNSLAVPFVFDDIAAIPDNPNIRSLWPLSQAMTSPPDTTTASGRPILSLSLALNYAVSGLDLAGLHLVNLAIHVVAGLALYGIVRRTIRLTAPARDATALAAAVAAIWLLHPLQTESVTYLIQRAESLMGMFALIALYAAVRAFEPATGLRRGWAVVSVSACALAMGTKEAAAAVPLLILLHGWVFRTDFADHWRRGRLLYAGLAACWLPLGYLVAQGSRSASVGFDLVGLSSWQYFKLQTNVLLHYLSLSVWPDRLIFDYTGWPVPTRLVEWAPAAAILTSLAVAGLVALVRRSWLGYPIAWFFLLLAPSSSFIPIVTEVAAEHRMYLPLAAVLAGLVIAASGLLEVVATTVGLGQRGHRRLAIAVAVAAAGLLGVMTERRNHVYRTDQSLWADVLAKRPHNPRAHGALGWSLAKQGRYHEAIVQYRAGLAVAPDDLYIHFNLAQTYYDMGAYADAVTHLEAALRVDPAHVRGQFNLAAARAKAGDERGALAAYRHSARLATNWERETDLKTRTDNREDLLAATLALARLLADAKDLTLRQPAEGLRLLEGLCGPYDCAAEPLRGAIAKLQSVAAGQP